MKSSIRSFILCAASAATLVTAVPVHAQAATFRVTLGTRPRWTTVHGTRVMVIRNHRPDYDMFRYGNAYYAYDNDRWYTSDRWNGDYRVVDEGSLPRDFHRVPRSHWRHYPRDWDDRRVRSDDDRDHHR